MLRDAFQDFVDCIFVKYSTKSKVFIDKKVAISIKDVYMSSR